MNELRLFQPFVTADVKYLQLINPIGRMKMLILVEIQTTYFKLL